MTRTPTDLLYDARGAYFFRYHAQPREQKPAIKAAVIKALGGCCACCGESIREMLIIDHRNGDGHTERKKDIYKHVWALGCPSNRYQLLCLNCNTSKARGERCAHQS